MFRRKRLPLLPTAYCLLPYFTPFVQPVKRAGDLSLDSLLINMYISS